MKWRLIIIAVLFVLMVLDIYVFRHLRGTLVMIDIILWMLITLGLLSGAPQKEK